MLFSNPKESIEMKDSPPTCENCGQKMVPIVYGFPMPELFEKAKKGEVILGGCEISFNNPEWGCSKCTASENSES